MKIKTTAMALIIPILIFGGIVLTIAVDLWTTTSSGKPAVYTQGENAGSYNPADIRGSYTMQQVSDSFKIDMKILYQAFGLSDDKDPAVLKVKDLESIYGAESKIGTESMQIFAALYNNLPIALEDTFLPKQAVEILLSANKKLTTEQKNYLNSHQVDLNNLVSSTVDTPVTKTEEESLVNGSTTFQQVLDKGVSKIQIEEILQNTFSSTNQTIKDYCIEKGLSFSEIKTKLNDLMK